MTRTTTHTTCQAEDLGRDYDGGFLAMPCQRTATQRVAWHDDWSAGHAATNGEAYDGDEMDLCDEHAAEAIAELTT